MRSLWDWEKDNRKLNKLFTKLADYLLKVWILGGKVVIRRVIDRGQASTNRASFELRTESSRVKPHVFARFITHICPQVSTYLFGKLSPVKVPVFPTIHRNYYNHNEFKKNER